MVRVIAHGVAGDGTHIVGVVEPKNVPNLVHGRRLVSRRQGMTLVVYRSVPASLAQYYYLLA